MTHESQLGYNRRWAVGQIPAVQSGAITKRARTLMPTNYWHTIFVAVIKENIFYVYVFLRRLGGG